MAARVKLGDWRCPSGNSVDVFLEPDAGGRVRQITLEWDTPPPLVAVDHRYYLLEILPGLTNRARKYLERPGPALALVLT